MDTQVLLWILGSLLVSILGLGKLWWDHVKECRARGVREAVMRTDIEELQREVGRDHNSGLRGRVHLLENDNVAVKYMQNMERP